MAEDRILVVDDEAVIRSLMLDMLADEGYEVETAASGSEALDLLSDPGNFIVLFTDIQMPNMDGIELLREAKKVCPSLISIVMTGYATLDSARAAVKEGAYDYVLKPFSLSEIKLAVSNAFQRYNLERENARLREATELFNISEAIASIRDERQLLDFVLRAALERVQAARGSIMLTTPDGDALEVAASVGIPKENTRALVRVGTGISGWVVKNVRPLLVTDIQKNPEVAAVSRQLEDCSFVSVPLQRKTPPSKRVAAARGKEPQVIAVLNVNQKRDGGRFTEADLKILSIIANHAAAALENVHLIEDLENAHLATLQSVALLLEAKDPYTHGHSERVRDYSVLAARRLGMSERQVSILRTAAALHDVGKIGVKDAVLNKAGKPTPDEWEQIKRHPVLGYEVLLPVKHLTEEHLDLVRGHHERMDGRGYPDGLHGEQLSPLIRVIVVADAYDAMASDRAYRPALSPKEIVEELEQGCDKQFDPKVARLFIDLIENEELPAASD